MVTFGKSFEQSRKLREELEKRTNKIEEDYTESEDKKKYTGITARHCIQAPPGYVFCSADFKNQELYLAAVCSNDQNMLKPFLPTTPATKMYTDENGITKEYVNPDSDLHLLTAVNVAYPYLFKDKPEHEWYSIATEDFKGKKGSPRKKSKNLNFQIIYLASPLAIAQTCYEEKEVAQKWYDNHRKVYHNYHYWASKNKAIAEARGWINTSCGRIRWCNETNSKSADNATGRMGVNTLIQGLAATIAKRACVLTSRAFEEMNNKYNTNARLCAMIHDELCILVPGKWEYTPKIGERGKLIEHYTIDSMAQEYIDLCVKHMIEAEEMYIDRISPGLGLKGLVTYEAGPYWKH